MGCRYKQQGRRVPGSWQSRNGEGGLFHAGIASPIMHTDAAHFLLDVRARKSSLHVPCTMYLYSMYL